MHAKKKVMMQLAAVGLLVTATARAAAVLVTPALPKGNAPTVLCGVVNMGKTDVDGILMEIVGESGTVVTSLTVAIAAGATRTIATGNSNIGLYYCRVTGISKSKARVTLCTRDSSFNCLESVTTP